MGNDVCNVMISELIAFEEDLCSHKFCSISSARYNILRLIQDFSYALVIGIILGKKLKLPLPLLLECNF